MKEQQTNDEEDVLTQLQGRERQEQRRIPKEWQTQLEQRLQRWVRLRDRERTQVIIDAIQGIMRGHGDMVRIELQGGSTTIYDKIERKIQTNMAEE